MKVKIFHTSDWHLGKKLFKVSRFDEQVLFIDWFKNQIIDAKPDFVIIAGDIFDTPNPPHEAIDLFYKFLKFINNLEKTKLIIISGNHDSGHFIKIPQIFFDEKKIFLWGSLLDQDGLKVNSCLFNLGNNKINIVGMPYFRNSELFNYIHHKNQNSNEQINTDENSYKELIQLLNNSIDPTAVNILAAHHLFGSFQYSGSEQSVYLSGVESINPNDLTNFQYIALGHIHKLQKIKPNIIYPGSPIPFRFSESKDKYFISITIENNTVQEITENPIPKFRKITSLAINKDNYEHIIKTIIDVSNDIQLSTLIELLIEKSEDQLLVDEIHKLISDKNIEIISVIQKYEFTKKLFSDSNINISELPSTNELFQIFLKEKEIIDPELQKIISEEFNKILSEAP